MDHAHADCRTFSDGRVLLEVINGRYIYRCIRLLLYDPPRLSASSVSRGECVPAARRPTSRGKAIASAVMSRRSLGRGQPFNEHAARADGADHQLMSDANGSPPPNENLKAGTLRCALDVFHREAFLLRELQPAAAGGRGRSAKPLRLDLGEDSELPLVDWDEAVVGQGAKVLTGNHIWLTL